MAGAAPTCGGEMNKMREAWDAFVRTPIDPFNIRRADKESFEAGYQAAIADVKAGGAVGRVAIGTYPFVADTYKLEDV